MIGLRHLALRVRDIAGAVEFYTKIIGMWVDWQPDARNVFLTSGSDNLALHQEDPGSQGGPSGGGSLDHFGFMVAVPEDVDAWAVRLSAHGVAIEQLPKNHRDGSRSIYFRDPDGNLIQILFHPHTFSA